MKLGDVFLLISPNGYEFANRNGVAERVNDLISGPSILTDTSSRRGNGSSLLSPKVKNDLPFKRRTLSIAVASDKKASYLN